MWFLLQCLLWNSLFIGFLSASTSWSHFFSFSSCIHTLRQNTRAHRNTNFKLKNNETRRASWIMQIGQADRICSHRQSWSFRRNVGSYRGQWVEAEGGSVDGCFWWLMSHSKQVEMHSANSLSGPLSGFFLFSWPHGWPLDHSQTEKHCWSIEAHVMNVCCFKKRDKSLNFMPVPQR